jgi:DNA-directed RNA polymerase specialized sigma24 family protein
LELLKSMRASTVISLAVPVICRRWSRFWISPQHYDVPKRQEVTAARALSHRRVISPGNDPLAQERTVTAEEQLAAEFETHRRYLHAIAVRVLGSHADVDDAMQEVWLRLARTGGGGIEDLRGWLTTVTGRICLDAMCGQGRGGAAVRARRRDAPKGGSGGLPDRSRGGGLLADSAGVALYPVMDALTPAERVSFVLHDVF